MKLFSSNRVEPNEMVPYFLGGIVFGYLLLNFPLTLLCGLLIAAALYTANNPKGAEDCVRGFSQ